ncbi:hypothetical protein C0J52_24969 [Blattella germanica]|nr:hypothetical protein C0J52_24969 [Blattella germanica]
MNSFLLSSMFECVIKCIELNNHYHFPRFTLIYLLSKIDIYKLIKYLNTHLLRTGLITRPRILGPKNKLLGT